MGRLAVVIAGAAIVATLLILTGRNLTPNALEAETPTPIVVSGKPTIPYPTEEVTQRIMLPPLVMGETNPKVTPNPFVTPTPQPRKKLVQPVFSLKSTDGKEAVSFTSLEGIQGEYRPWYYDEANGAEIKIILDKPAYEIIVLEESSVGETFKILSSWRDQPNGWSVFDDFNGNVYYFNRDRWVWVFPKKGTPLEVLNQGRKEKEKVGQLIYGPWLLGSYSSQEMALILAENLTLQVQQELSSIQAFEQFVSEQNTVGLLMGETDAKRFAYYNGQPLAKVEGKYFGWSLPNKYGQLKGESQYTHLSLAYNAGIGYDTPIRWGGVVFVNIQSDQKLFPHGTLFKNGKPSEKWEEAKGE
jgi:hypothetical protein